jgi:hypothetical protein
MWVVVFMIGFIVPIIIIGCVAAWRERRIDKENSKESLPLHEMT